MYDCMYLNQCLVTVESQVRIYLKPIGQDDHPLALLSVRKATSIISAPGDINSCRELIIIVVVAIIISISIFIYSWYALGICVTRGAGKARPSYRSKQVHLMMGSCSTIVLFPMNGLLTDEAAASLACFVEFWRVWRRGDQSYR